jgi:hypothetical protein
MDQGDAAGRDVVGHAHEWLADREHEFTEWQGGDGCGNGAPRIGATLRFVCRGVPNALRDKLGR